MTGRAEGPERVVVDVQLSADVETAGGLALCLAVADHLGADDDLVASGPDGPLDARVLHLPHGTRVHQIDVPTGTLTIRYTATVPTAGPSETAEVTGVDRLHLRPPEPLLPQRPSGRMGRGPVRRHRRRRDPGAAGRRLGGRAHRLHPRLDRAHRRRPRAVAHAARACAATTPTSSSRRCRALDIPARYVSVYAPGLSPMDAHAVVEVALEDRWHVVDATHLAPRRSMVRSGTGRDATDVALMTTLGAVTGAPTLRVTATADPDLPDEDTSALVTLR